MNKKIMTFGAGIIGVAGLAFGSISPAAAVDPAPTLVDAVCDVLPTSVTGLTDQLATALGSIDTTATDLTAKKAALVASINDLIPAVVSHIQTVSDGGNSAATGQILAGKSAIFADKVVAADAAMTANFAAQRSHYLTGLNKDYVAGVESGLCS